MKQKTSLLKVFSVLTIIFMVLSISGCTSQETYETPLNGFSDGGGVLNYILVYPLAYIMNFFGNLTGGNLAVGIFFLTIIVRLIGFPIYAGNATTQVKQLKAKPELDALNAKYAGRTDQQSQQQKMMEQFAIQKKYGISMMKSCLTMPIQFLLFTSMLQVLRRIQVPGGALTLNDTSFLGMTLSSSFKDGDWPSRILCIFFGVFAALTTYFLFKFQTKRMNQNPMNNAASQDPMAQQMMKTMGYFLIFQALMLGYYAASNGAMGFYYLIGNTCQALQIIIMKKIGDNALKKYQNELANGTIEIIDAKGE